MGSYHTYHATFKRSTYHRQLSHQHRCTNTDPETPVPPCECESIIYQAYTLKSQKYFKTSTKTTNRSLVIRYHSHGKWGLNDTGWGVNGYIKRHLKVTDSTESKRKSINSNLNGFKINSKADMLHIFTHFSISLHLRPVIKNKIIKTQLVLLINVTFMLSKANGSGLHIQKWLSRLYTSISKTQCNRYVFKEYLMTWRKWQKHLKTLNLYICIIPNM